MDSSHLFRLTPLIVNYRLSCYIFQYIFIHIFIDLSIAHAILPKARRQGHGLEGIFLAFQYPGEIHGVGATDVLRAPRHALVVITRYQRLLSYTLPDVVHALFEGRIVKSGDKQLALVLEQQGDRWIEEQVNGSEIVRS